MVTFFESVRFGCQIFPLALVLVAFLTIGCQTPSFDFAPEPQMVAEQQVQRLPIDAPAPDFRLPGVDGKHYSLSDFKTSKLLAVIFLSNHCPVSQLYEERLKLLRKDYSTRDVALVAISTNSPLALAPEDMSASDLDDTFDAMVTRASSRQLNFPYLYDGDDHQAGLAFGPSATPQIFVFDQQRKLRYTGVIDNTHSPGGTEGYELRMVLDVLLRGGQLIVKEKLPFGCDVKWAWQQARKDELDQVWGEKPVSLKAIGPDSLKTVLVNLSQSLRLVNFWASWCGPCKAEFPELLMMQRMYGDRQFEFVSVSVDDADGADAARIFLEQLHAPVANFRLDAPAEATLQQLFPDWQGNIPFTVLVEPLGRVIKMWEGAIDPLEVRRAIVDSPMLGRYAMFQ